MRSNDDLLSVQGSVYTLVDAEGYLVREDIENGRFRYPIKDDDTRYEAGEGLELSGNVFSVDYTKVGKNYSAGTGLTLSGQTFSVDSSLVAFKSELNTNKGNVKVGEEAITGNFELSYEPQYNVFINEITLISATLDIEPIDFTLNTLNANEEATFETWLTFSNDTDAETISIDENIVVVGDMPETLSGTLTHVFVRRVYKDASSNIHEALSYAYSF